MGFEVRRTPDSETREPATAGVWFACGINLGKPDAQLHLFRNLEEVRDFTAGMIFGKTVDALTPLELQPWSVVASCLGQGFAAKITEKLVFIWRRGTVAELLSEPALN